MATKFSDFLKTNKIDPRRVLAASQELEHLRPEDRAIKLKKRNAAGKDAPKDAAAADPAPAKRRSGKPVTPRLIAAVTAGKPVSGPQKTRLLRAVNHLLQQKKKDAIDLRALF